MVSGQLVDQPVGAESTISSSHAALSSRRSSRRSSRLSSRLSSGVASLAHRFLPDADDPRYPRPLWVRALRDVALLWWLPVLTYLGILITNLVLLVVYGGVPSLQNGQHLLHAALLDLLWVQLGEQPVLVVLAFIAVAGLVLAGHWAEGDATRESRVLLVRALREQATHTRKAIAMGRWAVHWLTTKLRHMAVHVSLGTAALAAGVALAFLIHGAL